MITNKKHLAFIDAYFLNGFKQAEAYLSVYKGVTSVTADVNASKLLSNTKIQEEVARRQALTSAKFEVKKEDLMKTLVEILNDCKKGFPPSALKAIEILNKMNGFDSPQKIEHSGQVNSVNINYVIPTKKDE